MSRSIPALPRTQSPGALSEAAASHEQGDEVGEPATRAISDRRVVHAGDDGAYRLVRVQGQPCTAARVGSRRRASLGADCKRVCRRPGRPTMAAGRRDGAGQLASRSKLPGSHGDAMVALQRMTGLDQVKSEIATLAERLQVEAARRAAGLQVSPLSLHMVFAGPPGVGQDRGRGALRRDPARAGRVGTWPPDRDRQGRPGRRLCRTDALKTRERIAEAHDGVPFTR